MQSNAAGVVHVPLAIGHGFVWVLPGALNMATPPINDFGIVGKWLSSLELHIKYSSLDDESYSKIQPGETSASQPMDHRSGPAKSLALQSQIEERIKMGDAKFSDSWNS